MPVIVEEQDSTGAGGRSTKPIVASGSGPHQGM